MKKVIVILLILCAGYWGSQNQSTLKSWWNTSVLRKTAPGQTSTSEIGPEIAAAPEADVSSELQSPPPAPQPVAPQAAPPQEAPPEFAPGSIYYTRERISGRTESGISVIPERTEVVVVGEKDGQLLVEANGTRVPTARRKLTNDPAEIASFMPPGTQARVSGSANVPGTKNLTGSSKSDAAASRLAAQSKREVLLARISTLERQIAAASNQMHQLKVDAAQAKARGRPSTYNDRAISALQAQISASEAERARLMIERAAIVVPSGR